MPGPGSPGGAWGLVIPAWCGGSGQDLDTGHAHGCAVPLSPGQHCLSHLGEPPASLLHLVRPSLPAGSCSWRGRHTKLGDLPRKQGMIPTGFVAGAVTSLWVPISECCRLCFPDLRCPPGSACLVRTEGWEGGWCLAGASDSALLKQGKFLSFL